MYFLFDAGIFSIDNAVNEIRVKTDLEMGDENYFCAHANTCNLLTRFSLEIQFKRNPLKLRVQRSRASWPGPNLQFRKTKTILDVCF